MNASVLPYGIQITMLVVLGLLVIGFCVACWLAYKYYKANQIMAANMDARVNELAEDAEENDQAIKDLNIYTKKISHDNLVAQQREKLEIIGIQLKNIAETNQHGVDAGYIDKDKSVVINSHLVAIDSMMKTVVELFKNL